MRMGGLAPLSDSQAISCSSPRPRREAKCVSLNGARRLLRGRSAAAAALRSASACSAADSSGASPPGLSVPEGPAPCPWASSSGSKSSNTRAASPSSNNPLMSSEPDSRGAQTNSNRQPSGYLDLGKHFGSEGAPALLGKQPKGTTSAATTRPAGTLVQTPWQRWPTPPQLTPRNTPSRQAEARPRPAATTARPRRARPRDPRKAPRRLMKGQPTARVLTRAGECCKTCSHTLTGRAVK